MSNKELSRLEVVQKLIKREIKQDEASDILHLSIRQVQRLLHNYRKHGTLGLISKKRNKPSNHQLQAQLKEEVIAIIGSKYRDFGPTLAHEKLAEIHNINISVETVRKLMIKSGFWVTRKQKLKRAYQPRNRRTCYGELIQIDGSHHKWFEDRGPKCALLVYIDDATGSLMELYFAPCESTHTYFLATQQYIKEHGKPIAFYSDKHSVFRVNANSSQDKIMTQFCHALYELNIDLIYANSPQAKGKVERVNRTLQDRLVKEFRIRDISDIASANAFMAEFKADFNKRFAKPAISPANVHRALLPGEDLERSLCYKTERTVTNNLTVQHDRILYLIENIPENLVLRRKKINLYEYPDGSLELVHEGRILNFRKIYDRVAPEVQADVVPNKRIDDTLELIKNLQIFRELKPKKRSSKALRKRHLGYTYPNRKKG
jgi:transposase